jgi:hypothetical protein
VAPETAVARLVKNYTSPALPGHVDRSTLCQKFLEFLIGCYGIFSYGISTGEVRILSPTPAMIIAGVMASPPVM